VLLAIDIGNTNIVIGVFGDNGGGLKGHWRASTDAARTPDEYGLTLLGLFAAAGIDKKALHGAIIASVVPRLTGTITEAVFEYLGLTARMVTHQNCLMPVLTDDPEEVGADRLVNAVAAYSVHRRSLIVVDFGTAVTFDYISEKGEYAGGIIAPGIGISSEALFSRTAKLPMVEPARPGALIGKNTIDSMRSGIFYGFLGLVDGIIERMIREAGTSPVIVSTGGLAPLVIGESKYITETDEFLTLKGLKIIYEGKM